MEKVVSNGVRNNVKHKAHDNDNDIIIWKDSFSKKISLLIKK